MVKYKNTKDPVSAQRALGVIPHVLVTQPGDTMSTWIPQGVYDADPDSYELVDPQPEFDETRGLPVPPSTRDE